MTTRMAMMAVVTLTANAACTPVEMRGEAPATTACRTGGLSTWLGKRASDVRAEEMTAASGARTLRWIAPNTAVTMDFRPDRLNVYVDDKGVIGRFSCA